LADDFGVIVKVVADILGRHGEQLRVGDWIISGAAATPIEIHAGDVISLELEPLGSLTLTT
jgi:2-keto-4-pentenoate hydratase